MDAETLVGASTAPQVMVGGKTYVGRVLSLEEFAPFLPWADKAAKGELSASEQAAFVRVFLGTVFPTPWWMVWRRTHPAVAALCALPWNQLSERFSDFFAAQVATLQPPTRKTSGGTSIGDSPLDPATRSA
jgi:hypothetical protein